MWLPPPPSAARVPSSGLAGRTFTATVEASSRAVDAASGTTRFQLIVDNAEGELMPGSFANVRFDIGANAHLLDVPASALIIDQAGIRVATVDAANRVVFKTVTVDITDVPNVGGGAVCDVTDGENVEIGKATLVDGKVVPATETRDYTCEIKTTPSYTGGTNTAVVTWDGGAASSMNCVAPDGTVGGTVSTATKPVQPTPVQRSMMKPASFVARSFQPSRTSVAESVSAVSVFDAVGGKMPVGSVATVAYAEVPAALKARTRCR